MNNNYDKYATISIKQIIYISVTIFPNTKGEGKVNSCYTIHKLGQSITAAR